MQIFANCKRHFSFLWNCMWYTLKFKDKKFDESSSLICFCLCEKRTIFFFLKCFFFFCREGKLGVSVFVSASNINLPVFIDFIRWIFCMVILSWAAEVLGMTGRSTGTGCNAKYWVYELKFLSVRCGVLFRRTVRFCTERSSGALHQ